MKDNFFVNYRQALKILEIGYMTNVRRWYTFNHPTLVDGILMYERSAPCYSMTEEMLNKIYIPAPNFDDAYEFLKQNGVQFPSTFINQPLTNKPFNKL